jgi:hypothetical protein
MAQDSTSEELVRMLCGPVRVITPEQISRTWPGSTDVLGRRLGRLENVGLIYQHRVLAHPELPLSNPLISWSPGQDGPRFERVAYALQARWRGSIRRQTVYCASQSAIRLYGGKSGRRSRLHALQVTHDLHVTAIFLRLLSESPSLAECWISEDLLVPAHNGKLPDAVIRTTAGDIFIEFGGAYRADRIRKLHFHCAALRIPYELW